MKLNGTIITGLFTYKPGLNYTANDLILYDLELFVALEDYDGTTTPDKSSKCMTYVDYHSYKMDDNSVGKFITANSMNSIIRSYFKGLTADSYLECITISNIDELDKYSDTGAYELVIETNGGLNIIPDGRYLFRVYKTKEVSNQELIDVSNGLIYWRTIGNGFNVIPNDAGVIKLQSAFKSVTNKLKEVRNAYSNISINAFNYISKDFTRIDNGQFEIKDIKIGQLVHLIITIPSSVEVYQYPVQFYITTEGMIAKQILTGEDYVKFTYVSGTATVTFSNQYHVVEKVYVSKGRENE